MFRRHALVLAACCSIPATALANGRFPTADQLVVDPEAPEHLAMGTTFGVLVSRDGGASWRWICEEAIGYAGEEHPSLTLFDSGTLLAGFRRGLWASEDDGCNWARLDVDGAVIDQVQQMAPPRVLVLTQDGEQTRVVALESVSDAPTQLGAPGDDLTPATIDVAAADPDRIYLSAQSNDGQSLVLRSADGGDGWERFEISPYGSLPAYISAVDPNDPNRLYVRIDGETTDHLLVSDDGAESFDEVLAIDAEMLAFALSPDGERVAAGGPRVGLFVADTSSLSFAPARELVGYVSCLRWTDTDLLACAREDNDDWTLGTSTDDGNTFTGLFHLQELAPKSCDPSTTTAAECRIAWESVAPTLGIETPDDTETTTDEPSGGGGCGCRLGSPLTTPDAWARPTPRHWWVLLALTAVVRRRQAAWLARRYPALRRPSSTAARSISAATPKPYSATQRQAPMTGTPR